MHVASERKKDHSVTTEKSVELVESDRTVRSDHGCSQLHIAYA